MDERLLEKLGLTPGEIKVYLALNKLGESSIGAIGSMSKVSKSKIYDILEKLIEKGLVGYIIKNNIRYFIANDPHMILEYLAKKEDELKGIKKEINEILPGLIMQRASSSKNRIAEIYEGFEGVKAIREELVLSLKPDEELLVLGAPRIANDKWEGWLLDFHRKRISRKVGMRIIYNSDARDYGNIRNKWKYTSARYLPNEMVNPNWIDIFKDSVMFAIILKNPIAFVVRDKEFADSFRNYFEIMWKNSKR